MSFGDDVIARVEVLRELRIGPRLFRQLTEDYRSYLGPLPMGGVTSGQLATLKRVLAMRGDGRSKDEILAELEAAPGQAEAELDMAQDPLVALRQELAKAEARHAEDRDRILTALIRTQQELSHLRQEFAASKSRRDRKKRGFFARLFG